MILPGFFGFGGGIYKLVVRLSFEWWLAGNIVNCQLMAGCFHKPLDSLP